MERCGAKRKQGGEPCAKPAGWGVPGVTTGRCKLHGGATPSHKAAAEVEMARQAVARLGMPVSIDPAQALLDEVARTYGTILFYEQEMERLKLRPRGRSEAIYMPVRQGGKQTGEARPHVLVQLWMLERKHYTDVCAKALHAGVARRAIELAEDTARQVVAVMAAFAQHLGLDPSSPEVREAGRAALQLVAGERAV